MKKTNLIILALLSALAAILFVSCERENDINQHVAGDNEIAFRVVNPATRASIAETTNLIPLEEDEDGNVFTLEETVIDLNAAGVVTRGTPVTTDNAATLYKKFWAIAYDSALSEVALEGVAFDFSNEVWAHSYHKNPWEKADPLKFFMWMPADDSGDMAGVSADGFTPTANGLRFSYESPTSSSGTSDAVEQEDIVFSSATLTKSTYDPSTGASIEFHHALTGVKFTISNDNTIANKTYITKVVINGLKSAGTCVMGTTATWTPGTATASFTQEYTKDNVISGGSGYPALNDDETSMTFWVIPQELTDNVTLEITFHLENGTKVGEDIVRTVALGTALGNPTWTSGQLHTFSLKGKEVVIHAEDEITNNVKENIAITNHGNTNCWIRAMIIGNWVDADGQPIFGYTDFKTVVEGENPYVEIPSWTIENAASYFEGLPGSNWTRGTDGYYYYTVALAPEATAAALFTSYTPPANAPTYQLAGQDVATHFFMEIAVQAIEAKSGETYTTAWGNTQ